jgi:hypothetical protein
VSGDNGRSGDSGTGWYKEVVADLRRTVEAQAVRTAPCSHNPFKKKQSGFLGRLLVVGVLGAAVAVLAGRGPEPVVAAADPSPVARGKYLVDAIGCDDCHSPKKMGKNGPEIDPARRLSGHPAGSNLPAPPPVANGPWIATAAWDLTAWSGPWGVSYAFNLTPDENTGLGSWSEETFVQAIRTGRHMGVARPILPPMPWTVYRNLSDGISRPSTRTCARSRPSTTACRSRS